MSDIETPSVPPGTERLTEMETSWTIVTNAHKEGATGQTAMRALISRYHDAIENYLHVKLRDRNLAEEVLQEFWHKLLTHKLAGADEAKGRFRDYLRTVLHRLIIDHFRGKKTQPLPPGDLLDPSNPDEEYDRVWRETILKRVWNRLETYEAKTPKNRYFTILRLRVDNPDASIDELVEQLERKSQVPVTSESFRKTLQRARAKYLELLIQELRDTINPATREDVEAEIYDLGLGAFYRKYVASLETRDD